MSDDDRSGLGKFLRDQEEAHQKLLEQRQRMTAEERLAELEFIVRMEGHVRHMKEAHDAVTALLAEEAHKHPLLESGIWGWDLEDGKFDEVLGAVEFRRRHTMEGN